MNAVTQLNTKTSLLARMAEKFGVDADKMLVTLKATAFKGDVTNEQMMALLIVAEQYGLNPWTKEIYAFPDKKNGIVPVVGVDGWSRMMNGNDDFDGLEFVESEEMIEGAEFKKCPAWIECKIYRKGRSHPVSARERFDECYRPPFETKDKYRVNGPWQSHTSRMLRHKATIQAARLAFGFVGIYDEDEAERIVVDVTPPKAPDPRGDLSEVDSELANKHVSAIADLLIQDKDEFGIADDLREYVAHNLQKFNELYMVVQDKLKDQNIISKSNWKKYLNVYKDGREHSA